jgi:hypothetical protein
VTKIGSFNGITNLDEMKILSAVYIVITVPWIVTPRRLAHYSKLFSSTLMMAAVAEADGAGNSPKRWCHLQSCTAS